jgi:hypothetical protein
VKGDHTREVYLKNQLMRIARFGNVDVDISLSIYILSAARYLLKGSFCRGARAEKKTLRHPERKFPTPSGTSQSAVTIVTTLLSDLRRDGWFLAVPPAQNTR